MTDVDNFRPRIRNWARVYRDKFVRQESNLMMMIRSLQRYGAEHGNPVPAEEKPTPPDTADARFIDACITRLRHASEDFNRAFPVLKAEYLTRFSVEDFESQKDERDACRARAHYARVFVRDYDPILFKAEELLCKYATRCEKILSSPQQDGIFRIVRMTKPKPPQ